MVDKLHPSEGRDGLNRSLTKFTAATVAHPDSFNPVHQALLDNDVTLEEQNLAAVAQIEQLAGRVGDIEQTSSTSVQRAVKLDWLYRDNRIAHELWAPGFTLIDAVDTPIIEGVAGDDSIDVQSTAELRVGEYYVLAQDVASEAGTARVVELVQCTAILSENRIRLANNLTRGFTAGGVLTRCSLTQVGAAYAEGAVGDIWLSKPVNIGTDAEGGAVVIRRSLSAADVRLYFRDTYHPTWTERVWSTRRQGGDIPAGFADYEYVLPMRGDGSLRIDIAGEAAVIRHIIALSAATGLGGFVNPAMRPDAPALVAPADGATGVTERPTLAIAGYASPGNTPQGGVQFQIAAAATFASLHHDSGERPAGLSYQVPASVLQPSATYYVRARVKDSSGLWSDWSAAASWQTDTAFIYVTAPSVVSPVANAIDVAETPTIQTGAFQTIGGADTHAATQYQVRPASGAWASPAWDSGEDTSNLLSVVVPAGILAAAESTYYVRARHKGAARGWSEWSAEVKFTTKAAFANVAGVALITAGGNGGAWAYIDDDGNTVAAPGAAYFNSHPVWGGMQEVTIDGQAMVKIPKFYTRRGLISGGSNNGKEAWWISDQPIAGYELHPAFMSDGAVVDQVYVGKYQASMEGSKLASKPGVLPAVSRSLTQFIADAAARNVSGVSGFMLWSAYQWGVIQWLYLVEHATMDSQAKTGQGRVSQSSAANVDASDVAQASYRGIVGLWGNVWQWVDGLKTSGGSIHLWDRQGNKAFVNTGKRRTAAAGTIYPTTFMDHSAANYDFADVFIGDTGPTSNSNATAPDYQWFSEDSECFPLAGGNSSYAADAGLWNVNCSYAASYANSSIGARLAKV
ncbi:hypothetical protein H0A70_05085 [Alcaligenaceae bacterium]|nr:hypothetical protein [Alcaligenaceae bacterium]